MDFIETMEIRGGRGTTDFRKPRSSRRLYPSQDCGLLFAGTWHQEIGRLARGNLQEPPTRLISWTKKREANVISLAFDVNEPGHEGSSARRDVESIEPPIPASHGNGPPMASGTLMFELLRFPKRALKRFLPEPNEDSSRARTVGTPGLRSGNSISLTPSPFIRKTRWSSIQRDTGYPKASDGGAVLGRA